MEMRDIKEHFSLYMNSKKIFDALENTEDNFKYSLNYIEDTCVVFASRKQRHYYIENFIYSVEVTKDNNFKLSATIKTPRNSNQYNEIIPVLFKKLNSKKFDFNIRHAGTLQRYYHPEYMARYLEVNLINNDNLLENLNLLITIVDLFNEKIYDKLRIDYELKHSI